MVLLVATPAMLAAVKKYQELGGSDEGIAAITDKTASISHHQITAIATFLRTAASPEASQYSLNKLVKGSAVYVPPPKPKPQQVRHLSLATNTSLTHRMLTLNYNAKTEEYKQLMERLRKDEAALQYQNMTASAAPDPMIYSMRPSSRMPVEDDDMTFADVKRQVTLIINVLVSILACGAGIWMLAWHWPAPSRLLLSMGGSGAVGVAEVAIYAAYIQRLKEAKAKEIKKKERRSVADTWVIEKQHSPKQTSSSATATMKHQAIRQRRPKPG